MSMLHYRQPSTAGAIVVRELLGRYEIHGQLSEQDVLDAASEILLEQVRREGVLDSPKAVRKYLQSRLGGLDHERLEMLWLDSQRGLIAVETLAIGTLNQAPVFPREVVKSALRHNADAAVLAHNHPSGHAEPSAADRTITEQLKQALALIDVRVLDHLVVAATEAVSFAERGWV